MEVVPFTGNSGNADVVQLRLKLKGTPTRNKRRRNPTGTPRPNRKRKTDKDNADKTDKDNGDKTDKDNGDKTDKDNGDKTDKDNADKTDEDSADKTDEDSADKTDQTSQKCRQCSQPTSGMHACPFCRETYHSLCMLSFNQTNNKICTRCYENGANAFAISKWKPDDHMHDPFGDGEVPYDRFTLEYFAGGKKETTSSAKVPMGVVNVKAYKLHVLHSKRAAAAMAAHSADPKAGKYELARSEQLQANNWMMLALGLNKVARSSRGSSGKLRPTKQPSKQPRRKSFRVKTSSSKRTKLDDAIDDSETDMDHQNADSESEYEDDDKDSDDDSGDSASATGAFACSCICRTGVALCITGDCICRTGVSLCLTGDCICRTGVC